MSELPGSRHRLGSVRPAAWVEQPEVVRRARLFVACHSSGVEDCWELLDALGLGPTPEEIATLRQEHVNDSVIEDGGGAER